ncbi:hypothetical protein SO802_000505 [Lithocarpus litseifolius]|uniref:RNase H type-1 domain-containing protein n=1 Tax=Lithocarpus litseifolius TaxID=425828 RepID=A0AAW2DSP4_9ROSI
MEWRADLIRQTVMSQDVDAILSIPLSANRARDRLISAGTKNGKFSVRSAYKMAQEAAWGKKGTEPSDPTILRGIWRYVWGMNTPDKLKHFAWKACKNILATKENLKSRNITNDNLCDACGKQSESACHIFCFCEKAKEVWVSSKLAIPFEIKPSWDFIDVVWHIQKRKDQCPGLLERIIAICWGIWKNRNEVIHGCKGRVGRAITRSSLLFLEEFQIVNEGLQANKVSAPEVVKWFPPRPGCYKVNVDGAKFSKRKQVGIRVVICDSLTEVVAALSKKMALPLGALETEAKALEEGIQFASDVGVKDVIFESDSMNICNLVQGLSEPTSSVQIIVAGILRQVQSF